VATGDRVEGTNVKAMTLVLGCLVGAARVDAAFPPQAAEAAVREDALLGAVLLQDEARVRLLLEQGVSPQARNTETGRTALFFAAEKGNAGIVRLLLQHGADVTARDTVHRETALGAAARRGHAEVVRILLARDPDSTEDVAWNAVYQDNVAVLEAALATHQLPGETLSFLLDEADRSGSAQVVGRLKRAGVRPPPPIAVPEPVLRTYIGSYRSDEDPRPLEVVLKDGGLRASHGDRTLVLVALKPTFFVRGGERFPTLEFEVQGGAVVGVSLRDGESWTRYKRVAATR
jgi:hypothetical protein